MKPKWTAKTSRITGCTAVSTSSTRHSTGEGTLGGKRKRKKRQQALLEEGITVFALSLCLLLVRRLKPIDIITLSKLHQKVNVIPLIAKADTLTKTELASLKDRLVAQFAEHRINLFRPTNDDEDDTSVAHNLKLLASMPFAVIGSTKSPKETKKRRKKKRTGDQALSEGGLEAGGEQRRIMLHQESSSNGLA